MRSDESELGAPQPRQLGSVASDPVESGDALEYDLMHLTGTPESWAVVDVVAFMLYSVIPSAAPALPSSCGAATCSHPPHSSGPWISIVPVMVLILLAGRSHLFAALASYSLRSVDPTWVD